MGAGLHGDRRDLGQEPLGSVPGSGDVTHDEGLGPTCEREVGFDDDAPSRCLLETEALGEGVGPYAGRPDHGPGQQLLARRKPNPTLGDLGDPLTEPDVDASVRQGVTGMSTGGRSEVRQELLGHLDDDHPGAAHVDSSVPLREHLREQLGQRTGRLDPAPSSTSAGSRSAASNQRRMC